MTRVLFVVHAVYTLQQPETTTGHVKLVETPATLQSQQGPIILDMHSYYL
jgi:hypothetical protein